MTTVQTIGIGRMDPASRPDWVLPADVAGAPGAGRIQGKRIGVVGGGLAGLTSAFILARMGVHVDLFEAADRFGGRVLTLRHGDPLPGDPSHTVSLPENQLVEAGATRIHPHMVTMEYLRLLDLPIAPLVTRNDDALVHVGEGGQARVLRQRDWWQEVRRLAVRPDLAEAFPHLVADDVADQAPHRTRRTLQALSDVGDPTALPSVGRLAGWQASFLIDGAPARALLADLSALKSTPSSASSAAATCWSHDWLTRFPPPTATCSTGSPRWPPAAARSGSGSPPRRESGTRATITSFWLCRLINSWMLWRTFPMTCVLPWESPSHDPR